MWGQGPGVVVNAAVCHVRALGLVTRSDIQFPKQNVFHPLEVVDRVFK